MTSVGTDGAKRGADSAVSEAGRGRAPGASDGDAGASPAQIRERLAALRARMAREGVDGYLVPSSDAHQNEYVPDCWQRRAFVTGFTGSAGNALIEHEAAFLWADSRYHLQAAAQLDPESFTLHEHGLPGVPSVVEWLAQRPAGYRLGVDPRVVSVEEMRDLETALGQVQGCVLALEANLVDEVWRDAPPLPSGAAVLQPVEFAGLACGEKLAALRGDLARRRCDALVVTRLDAVAWLFNLRGSDVAYNPLVIAYAWLGVDGAQLFVDPGKLDAATERALRAEGVRLERYDDFGSSLAAARGRVWVDPGAASAWVEQQLARSTAQVVEAASPILLAKACKNPVEQAGARTAHRRDGVAMVRFLRGLEESWRDGLDEMAASDRLDALRSEGEHFRGLSFPTISAFGPNGAVVHYRAAPATNRTLDESSLYLVDSGAQYLDGTTDVTRTVHLGAPNPEQRSHYTLVLRGHLALGRARFPRGTKGAQLDTLARTPLWEHGLDYGHNTGHGVGAYLNVHEGPQGIGPKATKVALEPGMILSNEPGYYRAGLHGIRIENLVLVCVDEKDPAFLRFEDLTLVPYCRRLIDRAALCAEEIAQVDAYHARVRAALGPLLSADDVAWLDREARPLAAS